MVRSFAIFALGLSIVGWGLGGAPARAAPDSWVAEVGSFGVKEKDGRAVFAGLEVHFSPWRWEIYPIAGLLATGDESLYLRVGLGRDFPLGDRFVLSLGSGVGYYSRGDGPELGEDLEFRSALDLAYRWREDLALGLRVSHLSNAGIGEENPGVETVSLSLAWRP